MNNLAKAQPPLRTFGGASQSLRKVCKEQSMRRLFRRQIRKTLAQDVPPVLQEANFAFDKGEYGRAGELFEKIAETADARGGPRVPIFYLQAGRARLFAGQTALGMPSIKRGLELFSQQRRFLRLHRLRRQLIHELRERGLN